MEVAVDRFSTYCPSIHVVYLSYYTGNLESIPGVPKVHSHTQSHTKDMSLASELKPENLEKNLKHKENMKHVNT